MAITQQEFAERHAKVRRAMQEAQLDAIIAYSNAKVKANVRYLTNYHVRFTGMQNRPDGSYHMFGSCACLFPVDGDPIVRTDQPWDVYRAKELSAFSDTDYSGLFADDFGPAIRSRGLKRVGIDNWFIFPAREFNALRDAAPDTEFVPTQLMSHVRRVKTDAEIAIMRRTAELVDKAIRTSLDLVKPGMNEYEVVLACEAVMREGGELELAGNSISGCGPDTSTGTYESTRAGGRTMEAGDWVMMDVCPRIEGYAGDSSRHRVAGEVADLDPRLRKMYDVTLLMSEEVRKAVRPGVSGKQLNDLASEIAEQEGLLENKIGLVGHGIGLDIHDIPDYYYDSSPLQAGEIITVEPCLLLTGVGGVRIEDMVLVTENGSETLTRNSRELQGSS